MLVYISLFLFFVILSLIYDFLQHKIKIKKNFFILCCVILSLVAGLRYRIGVDSMRYMEVFEKLPKLSDWLSVDFSIANQPLWLLINVVCKSIYDDFVLVQLVQAFAVNILVFRFIYKTTTKYFLVILAYYCIMWWNFNFEIMRESLCVAIYLNILLAYFTHKNIYKFLLFSIPILFIHWFSFIVIILTVVVHFISLKRLIVFCTVVALLSLFLFDANGLFEYFLFLDLFLPDNMTERSVFYLASDDYGFINITIVGIIFILLTQVLYPYLIVSLKETNEEKCKLLVLYMFFIVLRLKLLILSRIVNYWDLLLIVMVVNSFFMHKNTYRMLYIRCCFIYSLYVGIRAFYLPSSLETRGNIGYDCRYIPYSSYLTKQKNPDREYLYNINLY